MKLNNMDLQTPPPKDFKFLKKWVDKETRITLAKKVGIKKCQMNNVIGGRSENWRYITLLVEEAKKNARLVAEAEALELTYRKYLGEINLK